MSWGRAAAIAILGAGIGPLWGTGCARVSERAFSYEGNAGPNRIRVDVLPDRRVAMEIEVRVMGECWMARYSGIYERESGLMKLRNRIADFERPTIHVSIRDPWMTIDDARAIAGHKFPVVLRRVR